MFKRLAISLVVDLNDRKAFEMMLASTSISPHFKGRIPRVNMPYYEKKGIQIILYGNSSFQYGDFNPELNLDASSLEDEICDYIERYLDYFSELSKLKKYLLEVSGLFLIYNGIILHEDVLDINSNIINKLSSLGLGIRYNHVYDD